MAIVGDAERGRIALLVLSGIDGQVRIGDLDAVRVERGLEFAEEGAAYSRSEWLTIPTSFPL